MLSLSRECSGARSRDGASARADRTSSRFVIDFEPGRVSEAAIGPLATGALQSSSAVGLSRSPKRSTSGAEYLASNIVVLG